MTALRIIARLFGWLLTPLVAWAASFCGATVTAWIVARHSSGRAELLLTVAGGAVAAAVALFGWLALIRHSTRLRATLQVTAEGTPVAAVENDQ